MSCVFFRYLFPGGRPTPAPRRSTCLRLLLRSRRPTKEIPALRGRASGRRRKKEQSGVDGRTAGGQQEDNNRTASVHPFISNHTPPTGAARPIRPLRPPPPPPFTPLRGHRWNWSELQRHQRQWLKLTHVQNNFNKWIVQLFWSNSPVKTRTSSSSSVPNKKELKQIISNEKINDLNYTHQQTQNKHFNKRTEYIINTFSKSQNIWLKW